MHISRDLQNVGHLIYTFVIYMPLFATLCRKQSEKKKKKKILC